MTRIVLVHGFTQTTQSWAPVTRGLGTGNDVILADVPGHGTASEVRADLWASAGLLARACGRAVYVGYSMGARLALHVALAHAHVVDGLVLLGGTAGIDDPTERAERRVTDEQRAALIERDGVDAFLDDWLAMDMFAGIPHTSANDAEQAARRTNTPAGLASSLRLCGTGTQDPPLWDRLGEITVPTLVLAGSRDEKFAALGHRIANGIGVNAEFDQVPDSGHAAHLERPEVFVEIIHAWLTRTSREREQLIGQDPPRTADRR